MPSGQAGGQKHETGHTLTLSVLIKQGEYRLTLVADNAGPAIRAVTAIALHITHTSIRTIFTCQTAVIAKCVVQTHCVILEYEK